LDAKKQAVAYVCQATNILKEKRQIEHNTLSAFAVI